MNIFNYSKKNTIIFFYLFLLFSLLGGIIAKKTAWFSIEVSLIFLVILTGWFYFSSRFSYLKIPELSAELKRWIVIILLFAMFNIFPELLRIIQGEDYVGRKVDLVESNLHLLFVMMVVFLGFVFQFKMMDLWKLLIATSGFILYVILYEFYLLDFNLDLLLGYRFGGIASSGVIDFGIYANTLFVILIGAIFWLKKLSTKWQVLLILALLIDFTGAILSQSRTAWIGWPEAIIGWGSFYFYRIYSLKKHKQSLLFLGGVILLVIAVLFSPAKSIFDKRVDSIISDITEYQTGNPNTSLGKRFIMYEVAINQVVKTPLMGIGINNIQIFIKDSTKKVVENKYNTSTEGYVYSHVHNQFLMSFLVGGILSFISLIILFGYLIFFFSKKLKQSSNDRQKSVAVAGLVFTITSFMTFMPESPLNFKVQFIFFFVIVSLLLIVNEVEGEMK